MENFSNALKSDNTYRLAAHLGFLAGLLIFTSVFYFITRKLELLLFVKYYEAVLLAAALYLACMLAKKIRKQN